MSYDPVRRVTVLFGGQDDRGHFDDLWEWDGVRWTKRESALRPHSRKSAGLGFDAARTRLVLVGGTHAALRRALYMSDTWVYDLGR